MSIFKCKMCGGTIEFEPGNTIGTCDSCGTKQTLPHLDDDRRFNLYDRANHFRRNNEFDKASSIYEQILNEDTTDSEAYWSLVLCNYGIEYVEDPSTHKRVPTVNRAQFTSIFDDDNYKSALQYADSYQREIYEQEAKEINDIQKGILSISQKEEPFDVFICYKETDANGRRTVDSVLANELYHGLVQEGFKVFFSRITLEDKLGTAYEPYIFAALNSAKVMVVLGTKPEYFNAVWVKNEWSRYLSLVKKSNGKKVLIPAYKDMDPYDLPEEFSHLQAQDMSKLGFMQDLIRGIKKIAKTDEPKPVVKETVVIGENANVAPLLKRAFIFLEDGDWSEADTYCEKVLDQDPENAQAYLGKLMAELKVHKQEDLADCEQPFEDNSNYQKAIKYGDENIISVLNGYITHINERNDTVIYNNAVNAMNKANSEASFKSVAETFKTISGFKDADLLKEQCLEKAENCRKDDIYNTAVSKMNSSHTEAAFNSAAEYFKSISGYKDADNLVNQCINSAECCRLESERKAEQKRISDEKAARKKKKSIAIIISIIILCLALVVVLLLTVIIPNTKYNSAINLYNAGNYNEAIIIFKDLNGYKDSSEQIAKCETGIKESKYNNAIDLYYEGKYDEAIEILKSLDGYKESLEQISMCETAIKYNEAIALYNAEKYEEAIVAFKALNGYKDSSIQISNCEKGIKYKDAISLIGKGDIINAYESLIALNGYKDSAQKANSIFNQYKTQKLKSATVGSIVYFGSYEQDNNKSNGKENIEWLVLAKEGNKALLISKYALDCQQYNTSYISVTWETCSLRKWLNGTFLNTAFSSEEQNSIKSTFVTADKNPKYSTSPGNNTTDKVFLLSITEVNKYFKSDDARKCAPTDYAISQGVYTSSSYSTGGKATWWWLRSPGNYSDYASGVSNYGSVRNIGYGVIFSNVAVRPALWINIGE